MPDQTLTVQRFREIFPIFTQELYPDGAVSLRLGLAEAFCSPCVWRPAAVREYAMALYTAHFLAAYGSAVAGGSGTGSAGQALGMGTVTSKSVDGASVSYDVTTSSEQGAGFWNSTPWGRELYRMMQAVGAGAIQL